MNLGGRKSFYESSFREKFNELLSIINIGEIVNVVTNLSAK